MFELHSQLKKDCLVIGHFPLCQLLLMHDANYPWYILVPQRANVSETYQLSDNDQIQLSLESAYLAQVLANAFQADKMNIASLGNIVPQLHIHHIVRYRNDVTWPTPVWGKVARLAYSEETLNHVIAVLKKSLFNNFTFMV